MRRVLTLLVLLVLLGSSAQAETTGRIKKVLPQYLDLKGRNALSPSLYDRDAYQAKLRHNPDLRSSIRFSILWKAWAPSGTPLKVRLEVRGDAPGRAPFEKTFNEDYTMGHLKLSRWVTITLAGDDYQKLGELTAWRVTLWDGDQMIGEQKSFLW